MNQLNIHPQNNKDALPMINLNNLAKVTVGQVLRSPPNVPNEAWAPTIMHNFIIQAQQAMLAENQQKLAQTENSLMRKSAENYRKQMEAEVEKLNLNSINAANNLEIESLKSELEKARTDLQHANQVSTNISSTLESLISTFSTFVTSKIEQQTNTMVHVMNSLVAQHKGSQSELLNKIINDHRIETEKVAKRFEFQTKAVEDLKQKDRTIRRTPFQEENFQQINSTHNMENVLRQERAMKYQLLKEKEELLAALNKVERERDEARSALLSYNQKRNQTVACGVQFYGPPAKFRKMY